MTHLLVTNDFPPKHGGIQSYLWELWRRLPADEVAVLTTPYAGADRFDREQPFRIERVSQRVMLPTRGLLRRVEQLADDVDARLVLVDPALPLGLIAPRLSRPYGALVHGAEMVVPSAVPGSRALLQRVLRGAQIVLSSGDYPAAEARRIIGRDHPPVLSIPPGVDADRYRPLDGVERMRARRHLGLPERATVVLGLSRLVPRKGFDVLLRAAARLAPGHPDLLVVVAGGGRDRRRLETLARRDGAPARFLGRVADGDLPLLYGCSDVFGMLARSRWRGLEQEGFGIVFLEASAAGIAQIGGASGGVPEAIVDGETGVVVDPPDDVDAVATALEGLLDDPDRRARLGAAARRRAIADFDRDVLAARLHRALSHLP